MNAFDTARGVEQRSMAILRPWIQTRAFNGQFVVTTKGPLARELQLTVGDALYNSDAETVYSLEIKAEETNQHGNFFLETWSNLSRWTPGWMLTVQSDLLLYHFIGPDELYIVPLKKLKHWAFTERNIYRFPERRQGKYTQLNDTWGRCVPIDEVMKGIPQVKQFNPAQMNSALAVA